jgi:hypothetical protein
VGVGLPITNCGVSPPRVAPRSRASFNPAASRLAPLDRRFVCARRLEATADRPPSRVVEGIVLPEPLDEVTDESDPPDESPDERADPPPEGCPAFGSGSGSGVGVGSDSVKAGIGAWLAPRSIGKAMARISPATKTEAQTASRVPGGKRPSATLHRLAPADVIA